jgi:N-acetylmuramoyl-L-alanine amidase CwlA
MTTITAPHPEFIPARWHGGAQTPRLIVLHSTVSPCRDGQAVATARFFATTDHPASAHYCVDPSKVVQCVGDHTVAYHCGHNQDSIGVEMCDIPDPEDKRRWDDANHRAMEKRAANLVGRLCLVYGIRPRYVGKLGLLAGLRGVTTHAVMSDTFHQSTHWDPGAWRRFRFMRQVRKHYRHLKNS